MSPLFRTKTKIEDFVASIVADSFPKAIDFFHKENKHGHRPLNIEHSDLVEIGAGMLLFFLAAHLPDPEQKAKEKMGRAFMAVQSRVRKMGANPDRVYHWWKAFTDVLIFKENAERLPVACTLAWEKLFEHKPYRDPNPLKSFGYFLQMEVDHARNLKLV